MARKKFTKDVEIAGQLNLSSGTAGAVLKTDDGKNVSAAVANTDFAAPNASYLVTQATNAPASAINLGALGSGVLSQAVSGGVATAMVDPVVLWPTGVADHAAYINAALSANAGQKCVKLGRGTSWTLTSPLVVPSNVEFDLGGPSVVLNSTMAFVDGHTTVPLFATIPAGQLNPVTTLTADAAVGDVTITVQNGATVPIGSYIELLGVANPGKLDAYGFSYVATNVVGNVVTLDRPLLKPFWAPAAVRVVTPIRNARIYGNGASITGTGDRGVQFVATWNCYIEGIRFAMSGMQACASFDWGGRHNRFVGCTADGGGNSSTGFAIEGQEESAILDCQANAINGIGHYVNACGRFTLRSIRASNGVGNSAPGVLVGGDNGVQTGSTDGVVEDVQTTACGIGISLRDGASRVQFRNIITRKSYIGGVYFDTANGSAQPSHDITFDGLDIQDSQWPALRVAAGCNGIQVRNLVTSGNCREATHAVLELAGETSISGWRFNESAVLGAVVNVNGATTVRLRDVVGTVSHDGYTDFIMGTENGATIFLDGYAVTRTATASHTGALLNAKAGKTVAYVVNNGTNPGWTYFSYLGAGHTVLIGTGVTTTGTVTTAAGTKTTVTTTTA